MQKESHNSKSFWKQAHCFKERNNIQTKTSKPNNRPTNKQTNQQTNKQTSKQANQPTSQTAKQTRNKQTQNKHKNKHGKEQKQTKKKQNQTNKQAGKQASKQTKTKTHTKTNTETSLVVKSKENRASVLLVFCIFASICKSPWVLLFLCCFCCVSQFCASRYRGPWFFFVCVFAYCWSLVCLLPLVVCQENHPPMRCPSVLFVSMFVFVVRILGKVKKQQDPWSLYLSGVCVFLLFVFWFSRGFLY